MGAYILKRLALMLPTLFGVLFPQLFFAGSFSFLWVIISIIRYMNIVNDRSIRDDFKSWARCIFYEYDGDSEKTFSVCGSHMSNRYSLDFSYMVIPQILVPGQSLLVSMQFLPSAIKYLFNKYYCFCICKTQRSVQNLNQEECQDIPIPTRIAVERIVRDVGMEIGESESVPCIGSADSANSVDSDPRIS